MEKVTDAGRQNLDQDVDAILNRDAALMRRLGQGDVAPDVISKVSNTQQRANNNLTREAVQSKTDAQRYGANAERFMRQGGMAADFEGTNRQADLQQQLGDILASNNQAIAGLKGDRAREIASANSTLTSQAQQQAADYQQNVWQQLMDLAGLKMQMENQNQSSAMAQLDMLLKQQELQNGGSNPAQNSLPDNLLDSSNILAQKFGNPQNAAMGQTIVNSILQGPEMRTGQFQPDPNNPDNFVNMTPEQAAYEAYQAAKAHGMDDRQAQIVWQAAYAAAQ
jgi:hypothetical protein